MRGVDRLSALPDGLITHILSFLPTKTSVSTSILARRWRFMWAYVPNLYFYNESLNWESAFARNIYRVVSNLRVQNINTLFLYCDCHHFSQNELDKLISTAVGHNILNLHICFMPLDFQYIYVPLSLFTCKTLVELKLKHCGFPLLGDDDISLPSLKKLYLERINYGTDEAFPNLFSRCPVLEELNIEFCFLANCYDVSSPTVEKLVISFLRLPREYSRDSHMRINAPELKYLDLCCTMASHVSSPTMTSLIEANIVLYYLFDRDLEDDVHSLLSFVDNLCKVKLLTLSVNLLFPFGEPIRSLAKFDNCKRLEFDGDWYLLIKLLESADNLEVLILHRSTPTPRTWLEPEEVPACLLSHLGIVRVGGFSCLWDEFCLVKYFLQNAVALKKMEIRLLAIEFDLELKFESLQKISAFKRRSGDCEVVFC